MIDLRGSRFTDILPKNLSSQLETQAFAYALGRQVERLCAWADRARVYAEVGALSEEILDVLALPRRRTGFWRSSFQPAALRSGMSTAESPTTSGPISR